MSQDQDTGGEYTSRELSGGTLLRYALVGIGLLCAMVVVSGTIDLVGQIRAIGSGAKGGITAKAEWSTAPGPKR